MDEERWEFGPDTPMGSEADRLLFGEAGLSRWLERAASWCKQNGIGYKCTEAVIVMDNAEDSVRFIEGYLRYERARYIRWHEVKARHTARLIEALSYEVESPSPPDEIPV